MCSGVGQRASPRWGCPIRIPSDHGLPAAPRGVSSPGHVLPRPQTPRHPPCAHPVDLPRSVPASRAHPRASGVAPYGPPGAPARPSGSATDHEIPDLPGALPPSLGGIAPGRPGLPGPRARVLSSPSPVNVRRPGGHAAPRQLACSSSACAPRRRGCGTTGTDRLRRGVRVAAPPSTGVAPGLHRRVPRDAPRASPPARLTWDGWCRHHRTP